MERQMHMDYTEKKKRRINHYGGIIVDVNVDQVELPGGVLAFREVVEHPGGVGILPVDADGFAYCVRQYRYPFGEHLLEIPAGKLEPGEDPRACAVRELSEETGFTAGRLVDLGRVYTSPGYSHEILYLYLALDLRQGQAHPDENEFLDVLRLPLDDLLAQIMAGALCDGKTVAAVLKGKRLLERGLPRA